MKRGQFWGLLTATALFTAGCSSDEPGYDYAIPSQVCGVGVDQSALKEVLPTGKKAGAADGGTNDFRHHTCTVIIDGKSVLSVSILRDIGAGDAFGYWQKEFDNLTRTSLGGAAVLAGVGDDGAAAALECHPRTSQPQKDMSGVPYTHVRLKIKVDRETGNSGKATGLRKGMETFVRSYIPELTRTWCR
ncbi:hypothetical protein [Streptomyces sp. NPDC004435]|uniref:hypothetical protein n=1 Tax=Streptomyces sp. NPDC004435 TaxID=3364701 RepID=UPI0036A20446